MLLPCASLCFVLAAGPGHAAEGATELAVRHRPPAAPTIGRRVILEAQLVGPRRLHGGEVVEATLWWRRRAEARATRVWLDPPQSGTYRAVLPASATVADVEYWFELKWRTRPDAPLETLLVEGRSSTSPYLLRFDNPVKLEHEPPPDAPEGSPVELAVQVARLPKSHPPPKVRAATLYYRRPGEPAVVPVEMVKSKSGWGRYVGRIPPGRPAGELEYWFEVEWDWDDAPAGNLPMLLWDGRSADRPIVLRVVPTPHAQAPQAGDAGQALALPSALVSSPTAAPPAPSAAATRPATVPAAPATPFIPDPGPPAPASSPPTNTPVLVPPLPEEPTAVDRAVGPATVFVEAGPSGDHFRYRQEAAMFTAQTPVSAGYHAAIGWQHAPWGIALEGFRAGSVTLLTAAGTPTAVVDRTGAVLALEWAPSTSLPLTVRGTAEHQLERYEALDGTMPLQEARLYLGGVGLGLGEWSPARSLGGGVKADLRWGVADATMREAPSGPWRIRTLGAETTRVEAWAALRLVENRVTLHVSLYWQGLKQWLKGTAPGSGVSTELFRSDANDVGAKLALRLWLF